MKRVFVDSSVLFTAVNSPSGGSAKLFTINSIQLVASPFVLTEVERNVRKKLYAHHLERFFALVEQMQIIQQQLDQRLISKARKVIVDKDAIILAEAKQARTAVLVTLDQKHFLTPAVARFLNPQRVMTPKQLIQTC